MTVQPETISDSISETLENPTFGSGKPKKKPSISRAALMRKREKTRVELLRRRAGRNSSASKN